MSDDKEYRPLLDGLGAPQAKVTGLEIETTLPDCYTVACDDGYHLVFCSDGVPRMVFEYCEGETMPIVRCLETGARARLEHLTDFSEARG